MEPWLALNTENRPPNGDEIEVIVQSVGVRQRLLTGCYAVYLHGEWPNGRPTFVRYAHVNGIADTSEGVHLNPQIAEALEVGGERVTHYRTPDRSAPAPLPPIDNGGL